MSLISPIKQTMGRLDRNPSLLHPSSVLDSWSHS